MKRTLIPVLASLAMATSLVAAQGTQQQTPPTPPTPQGQMEQQKPDVDLTGCLIQGSSPTVYILDNAKFKVDDTTEAGKKFLIVAGTEDLFLVNHVNHEVTIRGAAETKAVPVPKEGEKIDEKDLPKLTAKSVVPVADTCSALR